MSNNPNKMRAACAGLTGFLFLLWILPLGAFIKPKDEEKACNGKRAICLCSHLLAKHLAKNAGKTILKNTTTPEAANVAPSSHFYVNVSIAKQKSTITSDWLIENMLNYANPVLRPAGPIPKSRIS